MPTELITLAALNRELRVSIPAEQIQAAYDRQLKELMKDKKVKLRGFRSGKIPPKAIDRKYGEELRAKATQELMKSNFEKVCTEEKLEVISHSLKCIEQQVPEKNKPFEYVLTFEIYPQLQFTDLTGVTVDLIQPDVTDADLEHALKRIQRAEAKWTDVERTVQEGDLLTLDVVGTVEGKTFKGGLKKDMVLELGLDQWIPGFMENLQSAQINKMLHFDLPLPLDYEEDKSAAGKQATFEVTVHRIQELHLPNLDDDFAIGQGFSSIDEFKNSVRDYMNASAARIATEHNTKNVLEQLAQLNPIEQLPDILVKEAMKALQPAATETKEEQAEQIEQNESTTETQADQIENEDSSKTVAEAVESEDQASQTSLSTQPQPSTADDSIRQQAREQVHVHLLVREALDHYDIHLDKNRVRQHVLQTIQTMPPRLSMYMEETYQMWEDDPPESMRATILTEQVVDKLLETADITHSNQSFTELVKRLAHT